MVRVESLSPKLTLIWLRAACFVTGNMLLASQKNKIQDTQLLGMKSGTAIRMKG